MKQDLPRLIMNTLTAALGSLATVYCVTTAFSLQVRFLPLLLTALVFALVFTACFLWKKAILALIPLGALLVFLVIRAGVLTPAGPAMQQLLHDVLGRFSSAYPNLSFIIPSEPEFPVSRDYTMLFALMAGVLCLWTAWGVGYRSFLIAVAGTLPFLLVCVIINDTPPHVAPLVLLLVFWVSMLLAKERPQEPGSMGAMRLALTLMALLLVLGVIGVVYPKEDTRTQELPEAIQNLLERLPGPMQNMLSRESKGFLDQQLGADTGETLDLTTQGTRERKDTVMLQLSSTEAGVLYLRGAAKDIYTGSSWESRNEADREGCIYAHTSLGAAFGDDYQAAVEIHNLHDNATVAFTPYGFISCAGSGEIESDLRVPCLQDDYIIYYWPGVGTMDLRDRGVYSDSYDAYVADTCLELPEGLQERLYELALTYGYSPELDELGTIAWTAEFVRTVADYRLDVSRQPVNFDFVEYFLVESRQGYCVHFASAAAVMLRALGIPARYASGYRAEVYAPGEVTEITDQDTHAWAEAYISGLGWIPVETTPGFGESASLPEVAHTPEEPESAGDEEQPQEPSPEPDTPGEEPEDQPAAPSPSQVPEPSEVPSEEPAGPAEEDSSAETEASQGGGSTGTVSPWGILILLLVLLLLAVPAMWLRHQILVRRREKRFSAGQRNQCLIEQWVYLEKLGSWGVPIPDGMEALALKAKFSQHEISLEELVGFTKVVRKLSGEVESGLKGWKRFRFKWISCLDLQK